MKLFSTYLASIYYDLPNDWNAKIDAGKYLAGDFGSTISLLKELLIMVGNWVHMQL